MVATIFDVAKTTNPTAIVAMLLLLLWLMILLLLLLLLTIVVLFLYAIPLPLYLSFYNFTRKPAPDTYIAYHGSL